MAQETKVGLLAGLAFIVCFAVILTNRGTERFSSPRMSPAIDAAASGRGVNITQPQKAVRSPSQEPVADERLSWRPPAPAVERAILSEPIVTHRNDAASGGSPATQPVPHSVDAGRHAAPTAAMEAAAKRARLERRLDEIATNTNSPTSDPANPASRGSGSPGHSRRSAPSPAAALSAPSRNRAPTGRRAGPQSRTPVRYKVVRGDSLSRIARRFYGGDSPSVINAIFDANRSILPSANQLRAGLQITLPVVRGVGAPRGSALDEATVVPASGRPTVRPKALHPKNERWYEIQQNDRYAKIAREQLGDESRWREIFELNKAVFPNPGLIRPGVRIKLPALGVASANGKKG